MSTQPHAIEPESQQAREQAVTDEVVAGFAGAVSPRYREIMQSLVRHMHVLGDVDDEALLHAEHRVVGQDQPWTSIEFDLILSPRETLS